MPSVISSVASRCRLIVRYKIFGILWITVFLNFLQQVNCELAIKSSGPHHIYALKGKLPFHIFWYHFNPATIESLIKFVSYLSSVKKVHCLSLPRKTKFFVSHELGNKMQMKVQMHCKPSAANISLSVSR